MTHGTLTVSDIQRCLWVDTLSCVGKWRDAGWEFTFNRSGNFNHVRTSATRPHSQTSYVTRLRGRAYG